MSTAVGVLILDEPQDLCPTVRATLEHLPALRTIAEADLARTAPGEAVAFVVVDEQRFGHGLDRLSELRGRWPALRILAAFRALTRDQICDLLGAGADALVARSATPGEIGAAILALAQGASCLVVGEVPTPVEAADHADGLALTPREAEVLRFLSAGFSNKEVARRLTLSVRTVETHRLNLRRKTQTGRLKDLVSLARQLGLAPVLDIEPARRASAPH